MKLVRTTLVMGLLLNVLGWTGNVFLLGDMWDRAGTIAPPPLEAPYPALMQEALTFVSDFVFAFVLAAVFKLASKGWIGSRIALAVACGFLVWLGGVPPTYLGIVNSGYLPAGIAVATSLWALVTFIVTAPILLWLNPSPAPQAN
ncbi:MAG: hypothetical protein PVI23_01120 [Maricaulaceae bacterium]